MIQIIPLISIIAFTILLIAIGYYYRHKRDPEEFFMAERKSGAVRIASSIFTLFTAGDLVTLTAFAYLYSISGISLFAGFAFGAFILIFLTRRIRYKANEYKPYSHLDYFGKFLGKKSEKMGLVLSLIAIISVLIIQLIVGGSLISTLTGLSYEISVVLISLVIAIYLSLGGFNSVLTTDVIQGISMFILIIFLLMLYNPAGTSLVGLLELSDKVIPFNEFILLFVSGVFSIIGSADMYQRIFSAKKEASAKKGLAVAGTLWLIFGLFVIILGLKIFSQFPQTDPNNAFFAFLTSGLSTPLLAFISILIVASLFSTIDTELFLSSIFLGHFFLGKHKLKPKISRILIWTSIIIGAIIAFFTTELVDIFFILIYTFMIMGPVVLARLLGRGNDSIAFYSMLSSLILGILLSFLNLLTGLYPLLLLIPPLLNFLVPVKKSHI
ncbi:hypothetical protein GF386_01120 [Candidatus Pacearchaeota archaeon]|nr:hypothetical protein [Candidatus Pacearchaeota archaeon]MBD3282832.1 hypothetical protein [Candidatus Pacearchaeota archaeon]